MTRVIEIDTMWRRKADGQLVSVFQLKMRTNAFTGEQEVSDVRWMCERGERVGVKGWCNPASFLKRYEPLGVPA